MYKLIRLAGKLKVYRERLGLSQKEFIEAVSEKLGVPSMNPSLASYSKVLDPRAPRTPKNSIEMDDRIILGKIVFRSITKFETIVENAARGKFPCEDKVELTDFEYPKLVNRLNSHTKWIKDLKAEWVRKYKSN